VARRKTGVSNYLRDRDTLTYFPLDMFFRRSQPKSAKTTKAQVKSENEAKTSTVNTQTCAKQSRYVHNMPKTSHANSAIRTPPPPNYLRFNHRLIRDSGASFVIR